MDSGLTSFAVEKRLAGMTSNGERVTRSSAGGVETLALKKTKPRHWMTSFAVEDRLRRAPE
jgi:hypothetical protein